MKKYHLKVLYASSNSNYFKGDQYFVECIEATNMQISEAGCYVFYDGKGIKASFPIKYTIITKVDGR